MIEIKIKLYAVLIAVCSPVNQVLIEDVFSDTQRTPFSEGLRLIIPRGLQMSCTVILCCRASSMVFKWIVESLCIQARPQIIIINIAMAEFWKLFKGPSQDSIFQFSLFSTLVDIFAVSRPFLCTKLIHQSSPAEMVYLVQENQIFAVWINFSPGIN